MIRRFAAESYNMPVLRLKPGREKSLLNHHPWVFSGAVDFMSGHAGSGHTVDIISAKGVWLAKGAFSPQSQIIARVWTFTSDDDITPEFFRHRIRQAVHFRKLSGHFLNGTACRIIHAESDGLPGITVDKYGDYLVCQFLSAGAEFWKGDIVRVLEDVVPCKGIYERSDAAVRKKEGLCLCSGVLSGATPPDRIQIQEGALRFWVDVLHGHKTGFYLDQRENRELLPVFCNNAEVLNCFAYTGAFGLAAASGGAADVIQMEASADMLALAREQAALNGLDTDRIHYMAEDVFQALRMFRDSRRCFDVIVLDPPKFAESQRQLPGACRGYKDINLLAFKLLKPGGVLFTFSCSGLMPTDLFQKIVADAAIDAGSDGQIIRRLYQASDHPTALAFPEGAYLKGLVCRVPF